MTRRVLGLTSLVGRVVEITGVVRLFKRIIHWTPTEPVSSTFHSVFLGNGGDLICFEIWARASSFVITYASLFVEVL